MSLVFCNHQSESLALAHIAMMSTANPQIHFSHMQDQGGQWKTVWNDGQIQTEVNEDED